MKKVLFATSALVALSGAAYAEVSVTGDAQMGLKYDNKLDCVGTCGTGSTRSGWNVVQRARVHFTMTGETDSGLSFGAKLRADQANGATNRTNFSGGTVWAEGSYGKLTIGDIDSAVESAVGDLHEVGLTGLEFNNEMFYEPTDAFENHNNKGVLYTYKYGDATFYASFEDQFIGGSGEKYLGDSWSLGAKYSMAQYAFGIGYAVGEGFGGGKLKTVGLSAQGEFNGFTVKGVYVQSKDSVGKLTQAGISGSYAMANGVSVTGFYRQNKVNIFSGKEQFIGLGAAYDLGGGATLKGGIVHEKVTIGGGSDNRTIADFGLAFKF